jgi:transcription elongation factor SPT6
VNDVGVDLNILVDHDHMHNMLQFISGLGPRKAKKLIQRLKQLGKKVMARSEFLNMMSIGKNVFISAIAFLKIKVPPEEHEKNQIVDLLDQTRIHLESYTMAIKVACDVLSQSMDSLTDFQKFNAVREVI